MMARLTDVSHHMFLFFSCIPHGCLHCNSDGLVKCSSYCFCRNESDCINFTLLADYVRCDLLQIFSIASHHVPCQSHGVSHCLWMVSLWLSSRTFIKRWHSVFIEMSWWTFCKNDFYGPKCYLMFAKLCQKTLNVIFQSNLENISRSYPVYPKTSKSAPRILVLHSLCSGWRYILEIWWRNWPLQLLASGWYPKRRHCQGHVTVVPLCDTFVWELLLNKCHIYACMLCIHASVLW